MKNKMIIQNFAGVQIPKVSETNGREEWVKFGEDNLYPQYLLELYGKSNKNSSILNSIADFIVGNGFVGNETFISNGNGSETLDKILRKIALDLVIQGAFALDIVWTRNKKQIASIGYIPVQYIRVGKPVEDEPNYIYVSSDWSQARKTEYKPVKIQAYDPKNIEDGHQIMYVKKYRAGMDFYTLPHYSQCINWIEMDYEISNFHLNNAVNGWVPSLQVNFNNGEPSDEEKMEIDVNLKKHFTGTGNAGKYILTFADTKEHAMEIIPIQPTASDDRFMQLEKQIQDEVLMANQATSPMLFGIKTEGQLGGRTELVEAFEIYQTKVINAFQEIILEPFNEMAKINGVGEITIEKYTF